MLTEPQIFHELSSPIVICMHNVNLFKLAKYCSHCSDCSYMLYPLRIIMGREFYRCTYCSQTSSRKWNLNIHIQRRHKGMKNLFGSSSGPHSHMPNFASSIDNYQAITITPFLQGIIMGVIE
jgi:hypothetical protein